MKRSLLIFAPLAVIATSWSIWYHGADHITGLDSQATQFYAFFSGFGTWLLALIGYSGVLVTITHHLNCHHTGCWRISRHRINGTPWCNRHHEEARPDRTVEEILTSIEAKLAAISEALAGH